MSSKAYTNLGLHLTPSSWKDIDEQELENLHCLREPASKCAVKSRFCACAKLEQPGTGQGKADGNFVSGVATAMLTTHLRRAGLAIRSVKLHIEPKGQRPTVH